MSWIILCNLVVLISSNLTLGCGANRDLDCHFGLVRLDLCESERYPLFFHGLLPQGPITKAGFSIASFASRCYSAPQYTVPGPSLQKRKSTQQGNLQLFFTQRIQNLFQKPAVFKHR